MTGYCFRNLLEGIELMADGFMEFYDNSLFWIPILFDYISEVLLICCQSLAITLKLNKNFIHRRKERKLNYLAKMHEEKFIRLVDQSFRKSDTWWRWGSYLLWLTTWTWNFCNKCKSFLTQNWLIYMEFICYT